MNFIENIKDRVKKDIKTIVLPESLDLRVLEAAVIASNEAFVKIVLIGNENEVKNMAIKKRLDVSRCTIIDPSDFSYTPELINEFYLLRKDKGMTLEEAKKVILNDYVYFGNMLVKMGYADGLVAGAIHSSADILRAALQVIKMSFTSTLASSFMLLDVPNCEYGHNGVFVCSDCAMNINPTSEELAEIAFQSANSFRMLVGDEPIIALLSHSTMGSSKCDDSLKVSRATSLARSKYPSLKLDGEMQFDAAIVSDVASSKAPNSEVAGNANVLIFPDLDAGNIGYKVAERLAHAKAYGPITQGLAKPVNDLSRGCNASDIVGVIAITALQAMESN